MSEYIKKEDALKAIEHGYCFVPEATWAIRNIPSITLVRCKECIHWRCDENICFYHGIEGLQGDDFCSYGERRTNG